MRRNLSLGLLAVCLAVVLSGCIQSKTVVTVHKDGTGTIEGTLYNVPFDVPGAPKEPDKTEAQLKEEYTANAAKMGEGVTLKSVTALTDKPGMKGVKVIFDVADVSKISVAPMMGGPGDSPKESCIHFEFVKGASNKLTVLMPPIKAMNDGEDEKKQSPEEEKQADTMMAQMFKDMLIEVELHVDGTIGETNASMLNAQKDGVVLMREDLGGMVKDDAAMKAFKAIGKIKDVKMLKEKLSDPAIKKYFQVDLSEKVVIEFK